MPTLDIKLTPDIGPQIRDLSDKLQRKAMVSILGSMANILRKRMIAAVPVDTGAVQKAINRKQVSKGGAERLGIGQTGTDVAMLVGPNKKVNKRSLARIGNILEHGSKPHIIKARKSSKLSLFAGGKRFAVDKVKHPGTRPTRFMAQSLSASDSEFQAAAAKALDRILRKHAVTESVE